MKNAPIRFLIILGTFSMVAVLVVQIFWVTKAINSQEAQFNHSVQMALRNVVEGLCQINGNDISSNDPIDRVTNNYFIARTNYRIDLSSLDHLLKAELQKRDIEQDYEFGVYDCQTDRMVYGDFVPFKKSEAQVKPTGALPKLANDEYYFGVYFPGKTAGFVNNLGVWKITSVLTLLLLVSFSYALFVILKQKRLSEVQRDFINNMTHEFKTPLATLQVSAEVLANDAIDSRQQKYASIIRSELTRLERHVQQLLETSVLDHGLKRTYERVEVLGLVKSLTEKFSGRTDRDFDVTFNALSSIWMKADPYIIETVLYNLLDNAFKYGESQVGLSVEEKERFFIIAVSNDGPEISKTHRRKIFRKFYRIQKGDLHDVKGFGLGLYFVSQAVKAMKGRIALLSEPGKTIFKLTLPKASD